jgi:hypothetical protein
MKSLIECVAATAWSYMTSTGQITPGAVAAAAKRHAAGACSITTKGEFRIKSLGVIE